MSPHVTPAEVRSKGGGWPSLARVAVLAVALLTLVNLLVQINWGLNAPPKTDYLPFATGARVLHDDPSCLYCTGAQAREQAAILGYVPRYGFPQPYVNPPLVAFLLQPLSGLSLRSGLAVLLLVLLVALALAARLFERLLPRSWPPQRRLALVALSVMSLPAATALGLAQWAPVLLLCAFAALACMRQRRFLLAGVLLSVLLIKPQTVWLVLPALAAAGAWRVLGGFALGAAGWALTGLALVGWDQLLQWPRLILERHVDEAYRTAGLPGIVTAITGSGQAAFVAAMVMGSVAVLAAFVFRSRLRGRPDLALAVGIAVSMAFAPHVFPDDLMLLAVTVAIWAPRAWSTALAGVLALSAAYLVDGWLPSRFAHLTAVASVAVAVGVVWTLWGPRRTEPAGAKPQVGRVAAPAP